MIMPHAGSLLTGMYTSLLQPLFDYADVARGEISEGCCKELITAPTEPRITEEHLK